MDIGTMDFHVVYNHNILGKEFSSLSSAYNEIFECDCPCIITY
jgi:hypothetical protein